jgi:anti-anti-sigma factor
MEQRLCVVVSKVDDISIVRPEGVLDIEGATAFEHHVRTAIRKDPAELVVDLRGVGFMDSIGLRALFRACHWCERAHVQLSVVAGGDPVRRVLRLTGADMWLPLVEDVPRRRREPVPV